MDQHGGGVTWLSTFRRLAKAKDLFQPLAFRDRHKDIAGFDDGITVGNKYFIARRIRR